MKCLICKNKAEKYDTGIILKKYQVKYYRCPLCGFVFTEKPYWLNEAYSSAIAESDVGLIGRNYLYNISVSLFLKLCFPNIKKCLDYGGGYGIFVRLMRDSGFDFEWYDKYCDNIFAKGHKKNTNYYEMITAFELFEHLENPMEEFEILFNLSESIIFSTSLISMDPPKINEWWYYAVETGQHISFYTEKCLAIIAEKYNKNLYGIKNDLHIMTSKKIPKWKLILISSKIGFLVEKIIKRESLLLSDYKRSIK